MGNWLSTNLGTAVAVLGFVGIIALTIDRGLQRIRTVEKKLSDLERSVKTHHETPGIHRNLDSEARWHKIEETLDSVQKELRLISETLHRLKRQQGSEPRQSTFP